MAHTLSLVAAGALLGACAVDPSLATVAAEPEGPLVAIVAEHDEALVGHLRSLASTRDLRLVAADAPLADPWAQRALFESQVRATLAALEPAPLPLGERDERDTAVVPDVTLVLSGHSMGYDFWGDLGYLKTRPTGVGEDDPFLLSHLALEFPGAFARVKHVYLLGCNTGRKVNLEVWRSLFPNAVSLLGFWQSGALGNSAWEVYHQTEQALTPEMLAAPDAMRAWLQDANVDDPKHQGKHWWYVGLELFPPGGAGTYMVSNESVFGDGECDQFICGAQPPSLPTDAAEQAACHNTYEGMSFDRYEQHRLAYESYFLALPGFEDTATSGVSSGPIRDYYNGVQGLADVYCCRNPDDPACPLMRREVETSQRLNHFANVTAWWLSQHFWELETVAPGLAHQLAFAPTRRRVLDLVRAWAPVACDRALADGEHTAIALRPRAFATLDRLADALCGLSFNELPDSTAITWSLGLVVPSGS